MAGPSGSDMKAELMSGSAFRRLASGAEESQAEAMAIGVYTLKPPMRRNRIGEPSVPEADEFLKLKLADSKARVVSSYNWGADAKLLQRPGAKPTAGTPVNVEAPMADGMFYTFLWTFMENRLKSAKFTELEKRELYAALQPALQWVRTSGNVIGLLQRFCRGMHSTVAAHQYSFTDVATRQAVIAQFTWDPERVAKWRVIEAADVSLALDLTPVNASSSAGLPFLVQKKLCASGIMQCVEVITRALSAPDPVLAVNELVKTHPLWFIPLLKAKYDLYPIAKVCVQAEKQSARPYYVWPAPISWFFQAVVRAFSDPLIPMLSHWGATAPSGWAPVGTAGWWRKEGATSLYKFSYAHGGADALMRVLLAPPEKPGCYMMGSYSDDQLYALHLPLIEGGPLTRVVLAPDVDQMDSRLTTKMGILFKQVLASVYPGIKTSRWAPIVSMLCGSALGTPVVAFKTLVVAFKDHLATGVAGTTIFDELLSKLMFVLVGRLESELMVKLPPGTLTLDVWKRDVLLVAATQLGMVLKPETLKEHLVTEDGCTAPFLGCRLQLARPVGEPQSFYIPVGDISKLTGSLFWYTRAARNQTQAEDDSLQMERSRQLIAQGLHTVPALYKSVRAWYQSCLRAGKTPLGPTALGAIGDDESDLHVADVTMMHMPVLTGGDFPSINKILSLYAPPGITLSEEQVSVNADTTVSNVPAEIGAWGEEEEDSLDVLMNRGAAGASTTVEVPPVAAKRLYVEMYTVSPGLGIAFGLSSPWTREQKEAFNKQVADRRALRQAMTDSRATQLKTLFKKRGNHRVAVFEDAESEKSVDYASDYDEYEDYIRSGAIDEDDITMMDFDEAARERGYKMEVRRLQFVYGQDPTVRIEPDEDYLEDKLARFAASRQT